MGALAGVRVIDLTSIAMGPYATQILGDMGADVIKVESLQGDQFRYIEPSRHPGMSAAFLNLNRNKRSIALDLTEERGRRILYGLVSGADVFISNIRPQSLLKLGLDYDSVRLKNERLIYCGTYGFSEKGPYAGHPALDDTIQAMSGLVSLQRDRQGGQPKYISAIIADKITGLTAASAISMALFEREKSGIGQAIEVPMFETLVSFNLIEHMSGQTFSPSTGPMGYERLLSPNRRPYRTKDGYIALLPYTTAQWRRFFEIAGRPECANDERFMGPSKRSQNIDELYQITGNIVLDRTTEEWLELMRAADIPAGKVMSPEELLKDDHLQSLNFFQVAMHPTEGEIRTIGIPAQFSRTPGEIIRLAPRLDEHWNEILSEFGISEEESSRTGIGATHHIAARVESKHMTE